MPDLAPANVKSGEVVTVGAPTGIAACDAAQGAEVEVALVGSFELPNGNAAVTQGAKCYWDATNEVVTATATGNTLLGAAILTAGADAATVREKHNGTAT